jgi:heme/copper-type cytochrome/quinol oxidase subunit 1
MENTMIATTARSAPARPEARAQRRALSRWLIPVGGGLLAALLIVVGTPHVAWYLRAALALIAFAYISGQSAAYLWSSHSDQG